MCVPLLSCVPLFSCAPLLSSVPPLSSVPLLSSVPPLASAPPLASVRLLAPVPPLFSCAGSLRRSLFSTDEERQSFLQRMVSGTLHILQSQCGLSDHGNYHELCRLLARLKANFQLAELVQCANYAEWISMVASFTIDSFKHWEWAANSVYYLLSLW